ncbi:ornithine carbamoyltransferase [Candidatus Tenderia electrophaga]|uniref:Ornithine carbamoyltransferase n=1 Tax=Candidatus Tenderia electrophaga TaxID=1748243 RepID=A0A0S2TI76_9GAMM|nr:ornithine carbamoyltransferase [Candidatus Tenderia electrophaga]
MAARHFITLMDFTPDELQGLIQRAIELKRMQGSGAIYEPLKNKVLGMVFEKSSTRTRVAFETAMAQCGGHAIFLSPRDTQLGRGEPIEDSARVLSRMVDVIMIRTYEHEKLLQFAKYSQVPVINALTDMQHPIQLLADIQTYVEHRGEIRGRRVAYIGDGNNMCHSYIDAARQFGFELVIASPAGYLPDPAILKAAGASAYLVDTTQEAAKGADLIVTDVWASMGREEELSNRRIAFGDYQVNQALMQLANPDCLFMHCLPAHREEEVSAEVMDGPQSVVWDEAENRLHSQKALLEFLLTGKLGG